MHKKRLKICTCYRVSEAKFYSYHSTKIAKAGPWFDDWPEHPSIQINSLANKCCEPVVWEPIVWESFLLQPYFFILKLHWSNDSNDFHVSEKRAFIKEDSFSGLVMTFASRHVATP